MTYFSIILPTYNRAHLLPKAIQSVVDQTFSDWELIIIDDGSKDDTKAVVEKFQDERIRYIYQENQERSTARNNGINNAKGEYICFLDSDDYFLPDKLNNFKSTIERISYDQNILFYDGLIFETNKERRHVDLPLKNNQETVHEFLLQNPIGPLQVCGPTAVFLKYSFNPKIRIGEDVELWLRMADSVKFQGIESFQTVALEHEDRSVNLIKHNSAKEQLKQLELIFQYYDYQQISKKVHSNVISNCYFNSAKHFMMNGMKWKAINEIIKSITSDILNVQLKHRIYCLFLLLLGKIPSEYNS